MTGQFIHIYLSRPGLIKIRKNGLSDVSYQMGFYASGFEDLVDHGDCGALSFGSGNPDNLSRAVVKKNLCLAGYFAEALLWQDFKRDARGFYYDIVSFELFQIVFVELLVGYVYFLPRKQLLQKEKRIFSLSAKTQNEDLFVF